MVAAIRASLKRQASNLILALNSLEMLPVCLVLVFFGLRLASSFSLQLNGDSILLSIMSLQKLTVYFWSQDRFGNLSPLLAAWIRDPAWNAIFQFALRLLAGLLAPAFFCAFVFRRPIDVWRATLVADGLLLVTGSRDLLRETFIEASPYGISFACAALASMALRDPRAGWRGTLTLWLGALGLLCAYVVNVSLLIIALPVAGLFALLRPSASMTRLVILHAAAALIALRLPGVVAGGIAQTPQGLHVSADALGRFAGVVREATGWAFALAVLLPSAALILLLRATRRSRVSRKMLGILAAMLSVAAGAFVVIASSSWVAMNAFSLRYTVPCCLLLASVGGMSLWAAARLAVRHKIRRGIAFVAMALVLVLATSPVLRPMRAIDIDIIGNGKGKLARAVAMQVVARQLDGIVGDYWDVWPAVFMAEQFHHDAGYGGPNVIGIADRGEVRRTDFAVRLAMQGRLRLACIDRLADACVAHVVSTMGTPGLRAAAIATVISPGAALQDRHELNVIEVMAGEASP